MHNSPKNFDIGFPVCRKDVPMSYPSKSKKRRSLLHGVMLSLVAFAIASLPSGAGAAQDSVDRLVSELRRQDWQTSLASREWVSRYNNRQSFETITALISNKGIPWKIRIRAIRLLGATRNPDGISVLAEIMSDPIVNNDCPAIKWNTATALSNFKGDKVVYDTLINAMRFEIDTVVREAVINALGKIGNPGAVPFLTSVLDDKSFAIKMSAVRALGEIGDPSADELLKRVAEKDADPYIRKEALYALKRLNGHERG